MVARGPTRAAEPPAPRCIPCITDLAAIVPWIWLLVSDREAPLKMVVVHVGGEVAGGVLEAAQAVAVGVVG